jgi:hypothetical protein
MSDSDYLTERATNLDLRDDQTDERRDIERRDTERRDTERRDTEGNQAERDRVDGAGEVGPAAATEHGNGLVSDPESFRRRWESVQVGFVDDPRQAVGDADALVSSVIEDLAEGFRRQRQRLESRWSEGEDASTDDLRESFQRYRDFFERLLQV